MNTLYKKAEGFGNSKFTGFRTRIRNWNYPHSHLYWTAINIAYNCSKARKRTKVKRKLVDRRLIDIWWTYYYLRNIKLNGIHLGKIYEDTYLKGTLCTDL